MDFLKCILVFGLAIFILFGTASLITYTTSHNAGWYCEYCHTGSYRNKYEVEQCYGNTPCKFSEDSCHHFIYFLKEPKEKPKYVK